MKKGLLLGNGINSRIGVDSFSVDNIWRRFIENIRKYKPVFEATFDITIYEDEIVDVLLNSSNRGIETLAGTVYKYICDKIGSKWSTNDDIRLQDLLTCIAITTIFLDENGKKKVNYKVDQLPDFSVYDMVFTLNYYEFWDYNHIAVPLHGRVDLDAIHENINVLVSSLRMSYAFDEPKQWEIREINEIMNQCIDRWRYFPNPRMFSEYGRQKGWERENPATDSGNPSEKTMDGFVEVTEQMELPF